MSGTTKKPSARHRGNKILLVLAWRSADWNVIVVFAPVSASLSFVVEEEKTVLFVVSPESSKTIVRLKASGISIGDVRLSICDAGVMFFDVCNVYGVFDVVLAFTAFPSFSWRFVQRCRLFFFLRFSTSSEMLQSCNTIIPMNSNGDTQRWQMFLLAFQPTFCSTFQQSRQWIRDFKNSYGNNSTSVVSVCSRYLNWLYSAKLLIVGGIGPFCRLSHLFLDVYIVFAVTLDIFDNISLWSDACGIYDVLGTA